MASLPATPSMARTGATIPTIVIFSPGIPGLAGVCRHWLVMIVMTVGEIIPLFFYTLPNRLTVKAAMDHSYFSNLNKKSLPAKPGQFDILGV